MANIILPPGWRIKENEVTPKAIYTNRRSFIKNLGLGTIGMMGASALIGCSYNQSNASPLISPILPPLVLLYSISELQLKFGWNLGPHFGEIGTMADTALRKLRRRVRRVLRSFTKKSVKR